MDRGDEPRGEVSPRAPRSPSARPDRALLDGALAHFEDAACYDRTYRDRTEDVTHYASLARPGLRVLEYGIGTGRIAIPMARAGASVVGIDHAGPMLARLEERLATEPADVRARVRGVQGDMREARLRRRFDLVLSTFNTFLHLYALADVERFLAGVRAHLAPGGRFVFDVSVPLAEDLARDPTRGYRAPSFVHPTSRERVRYTEFFDYDALRQILFVTMLFEPKSGAKPWTVLLAHRQYFPQELTALLTWAGFDVTLRAAFDGARPSRSTDHLLVECTRRGRR